MSLRRDTSRNLLQVFNNEKQFIDAVRVEIEAERISLKDAEKTIIRYYQKNPNLMMDLLHWRDR